MLAFVIPLKSAKASTSWEQVSQLFERCVRSVCNQTSSQFQVIVACHEKPEINFTHPQLTYLEVDFLPPKDASDLNIKRTDKGRKVLAGLVQAREFSPTHTLVVDADDCISKRLAEFVSHHPKDNGWYIDQGYKYLEGTQEIYLKYRKFYTVCGTCNLVRYDLHNLPENPEYFRGYGYYKYYIDHQKVKGMLEQKGTPLSPLPFAGAVYMLDHGENLYYQRERLIFNLFNRRRLTPALRDEFGLYDLS